MKPRADAQIRATSCQPPGEQHEGRNEFGHRRTDIADAENAQRRALLAGRIEARDIGDADGEGAAGKADAERGDQHLRDKSCAKASRKVAMRRRQHRRRVDEAAAKAVGPDAEHDAHQASRSGSACRSAGRTRSRSEPSSLLMRTPMIEKIVQTAKQTVKARVDIDKRARAGSSWLDGWE